MIDLRRRLAAICLALATAPAIGAAPPASAEGADAAQLRDACRLARESVISSITPGTLVDFGPVAPPRVDDAPAAAAAAVQAWTRRGATNLFTACPELRKALPAGVRAATADDFAAVHRTPPPPRGGAFITSFTAPFVSRDGRYLITAQVYSCPGLCGGHVVQLHTRQGAGWSEGQVIAMAMS